MTTIATADGYQGPVTADGWGNNGSIVTADGWEADLSGAVVVGGHGSADDEEETYWSNRRKTRAILSIKRRWAMREPEVLPQTFEYLPEPQEPAPAQATAPAGPTFADLAPKPAQPPPAVPGPFREAMRKKKVVHDEDEEAAAVFMNFLMRDDW